MARQTGRSPWAQDILGKRQEHTSREVVADDCRRDELDFVGGAAAHELADNLH